jgi:serine/threonine protein kinase/Flp pilus assembly protein TadD
MQRSTIGPQPTSKIAHASSAGVVAVDEESIFLEALQKPTATDRAAFLDEACAGNVQLRRSIEQLLQAHERAGSFLQGHPPPPTVDQPVTDDPGMVIGPYKLLQQIGEGGMGTVFMAEQKHPVQRKVALKIIKPGMDSRQVLARFDAERQALALMDHPNIARVLDAGTSNLGRPYFVMELVKGVPITNYCDELHLSPKQRLELFVTVCQAVQHAHQKGIIHRDLKPSNVLVAEYDAKPAAKVIDFGVAKAIGQKLTDRTMFTELGQVIGTLEYMSPEQAKLNALDIDTRTDIYALGVLLYELLTGTTPFEKKRLRQAALDEVLRIIREEEPPKPSTRLSTTQELPSIAANRGLEPKKLSGLVRGELDWIVMKCLEKDRNRRYETANGLAADLQHHLHDEAVLACPPSVRYRLRKFTRKNRKLLMTASAFATLLFVAAIISSWQWWRAEQHASAEQRERERAERKSIEAVESARQTREAIKKSFTRLSETTLLNQPGLQPLRMQLLQDAREFYEKFLQQSRDDPELQAELAAAYLRISTIYIALDRNDDAVAAAQMGLEIVEKLLRERPDDKEFSKQLAGYFQYLRSLGRGSRPPSNPDKAIAILTKASAFWEEFARDYPDVLAFRSDLAGQYLLLAGLHGHLSHHEEAFSTSQKALAISEQLVRAQPTVNSYQEMVLASCGEAGYQLAALGRTQQSDDLCRTRIEFFEKLSHQFPTVSCTRLNLALIHKQWADNLRKKSRRPEAEKEYRQAIRILENLEQEGGGNADSRRDLSGLYDDLAALLERDKAPEEVEEIVRKATAINEKLVSDFPSAPIYWLNLASWYHTIGNRLRESQPRDAEHAFRRSFAIYQELAREFPRVGRYWTGWVSSEERLVGVLLDMAQPHEVEKIYRETIARCEKLASDVSNVPECRTELARNHNRLGIFLRNAGRAPEAMSELHKAQEYWRPLPDPAVELKKKIAPQYYWHDLGVAYYRMGRWEAVLEVFPSKADGSAWQWFYLAMVHWQLEHKEEAYRWYYRSLDWMATAQEKKLRDVQGEAAALLGLPDPGERSEKAWHCNEEGTTYGRQGKPERAKESYGKAIALYEKLASDFPAVPAYRVKLLELLAKTGWGKEAERICREAATYLEQLATGPGSSLEQRRDVAHWCDRWAASLKEARRFKEAEPLCRRAIALWEKLITDSPKEPNYRVELGHSLWRLSELLSATGQTGEVEKTLREALLVFERLAADFPNEPFYQLEAAHTCWAQLGPFLAGQSGRLKEAEQVYRRGLAAHEKLVAAFPTRDPEFRRRLASNYQALMNLLTSDRRPTEALQVGRRALDFFETLAAKYPSELTIHQELANRYLDLGRLLRESDKPQQAEEAYRKCLDVHEKLVSHFSNAPESRRELASCCYELTVWFRNASRHQEAEPICRRAIALWEKLAADLPKEPNLHVEVGHALWQLAGILSATGRRDEAEKTLREALRLFAALAVEYPKETHYRQDAAYSHRALSDVFVGSARPKEAVESLRQAAALYAGLIAEAPNSDYYRGELANTYGDLANKLKVSQQINQAEGAYREAVRVCEEVATKFPTADNQLRLAWTYVDLGNLCRDSQGTKEAEQAYRRGLQAYAKLVGRSPPDMRAVWRSGHASRELAHLLQATHRPAEGDQVYQKAIEDCRAAITRCDKTVAERGRRDERWDIAASFEALGHLLNETRQTREAEKAFRDTAAAWAKMVTDFKLEEDRWHLGSSHELVGNVLKAAGQYEQAAEAYRDARAVWQSLVAEFNKDDHRNHLSWTCNTLTEILVRRAKQVENDPNLSDADRKASAQKYRAQARELFRDAIKRGLQTPLSLNNAAWQLVVDANPDNRDPAWAVELAEIVIEQTPDNGSFMNTLGTAYYRTGNWKAAIEALKKAEELNQGQYFGQDAFFIGMASWQLGEREAARKWHTAAVRWMQRNAANNEELRRFRAEAAGLLGVTESAPAAGQQKPLDEGELYTLIVGVYPEAAWAYLGRGRARMQNGEQEEARADYRHAVDLYTRGLEASSSWVLYANRGNAYAELDQWERASADYAKAVQNDATDQLTWYRHALLRLHLGDREGYAKACTAILKRYSEQANVTVADLALWTCVLAADAVAVYPRLVQWGEKLVAARPKDFASLDTLGIALYRAGRFEDALKRLSEANAVYKPADEVRTARGYNLFFLAMVHHRLGHAEEARKWLHRAIEETDGTQANKPLHKTGDARIAWNRRLTYQLLRREAESLVNGSKAQ